MSEEEYYSAVEGFLSKDLGCFATDTKRRLKEIGTPDVLGIRDVGGIATGDVEVIAVEVKRSKHNFIKSLGQALGYSLIAHKCYLAVYGRRKLFTKELFTEEEKYLATRLGVGLLEIGDEEVTHRLPSPYHEPVKTLMIELLYNLDLYQCNLCGAVVKGARDKVKLPKLALEKKRPLMWLTYLQDRRKVLFPRERGGFKWSEACPSCVEKLDQLVKELG